MSKKGLKTMLVCIVLLIGLVTLFACNKSGVADKDGQTKVIVKIQNEDGSIYKENVVFSDLFTLSLQKEGYTGRLYRDADFLKPLTKDSKVKNGDTVYVKWTINKYTVTFMDGEKVLETFTNVPHGSAVTAPEVPEKDGKTFAKWDKDFSKVTSDLTINAVYDVDTFTVTFKDGEKVLETQTVEYEAAATAPDTARLSPPVGMHFAKWDKDFSKVTEDIEVSAVYELNEYTVTFKNGETEIKTETVKHGFAATAPNVFDSATEKFVGWDKPFDKVTSDIIVNAKFETKKFTLTFINFDGTTVYTAEVEYGASIRDHFDKADNDATYNKNILDYDGWYKADGTRIDELDLPTMPAENLTLTLRLRLLDSAIGDNTAITVPEGFTYGEKSATFTVSGDMYDGVNYEYEWTILKDGKEYKKQTTTSGSITIENPDAGTYVANVKIVASVEKCGSVGKDFSAGETLTVLRADISGITVTGGTFTYGDENAKIKIDGLKDGDKVFYGTDGTTFPLQNVDLSALNYGEHDYYVRVYRGDNYNPYTSGKITVKIDKAEVTATVTPDKDKLTYGDNLPSLTATINGETYKIESGKYTLQLKDGMQAITGSVANNVGTYNINVDVKKSGLRENYPNYEITVETKGTIKINEAKLTVTVTLDKTELTYGEASPIITYTFDGLKLSDAESDFTITKTKFAEKLDVGTYTDTAPVKVSGDKTNFYNITVNTVKFKVNKRPATITIDEVKNIKYGDKEPKLSVKVDGVLVGDSLSYKLETNYTVGDKPGVNYTASVKFNPEAAENKNYLITAPDTTFNVGTKDLTIKLKNTATIAVGKTYTVDAEHLDKIGLVAGDTVTGHVTITKDVKGKYYADDFDKSNLVVTNADCYNISYDSKEISVEFVEVGEFAIDFPNVTLTYDGQPHSVLVTKTDTSKNYTITYGESAENCNLEESPKYTNAGAYPIYFKVVDNDTLAEHVGRVTLTINKKAVEIKVKDVEITYGGTPKFEYTVTGLVEGETLSGKADYIGAGTDAGVYDISVSGLSASDNYAVTVKTGKLTINKKTAEVKWTNAENRVYSPDGQTLPTATYDDPAKPANLIFKKDGKECEFKNAGTYTVTVADNNYILTNNEKTIVIEKATYADPALSLTGIYYDPNKTLGKDYEIDGITWVNPDEVPVCTKKKYDAIYNKDPVNYNDKETMVTLDLQKAKVTLAQDLFEFNYDDGASHEISTTVKYGSSEVKEPYTLTFEKNMFSAAGTHRTLVTMEADNYDLPENTYLYVKVKGVKVGTDYYTIEDALFNSKPGDTIEFISAAKEVSFAPLDIAQKLYVDKDNNAYHTVKAGVTLKLASDEDSSATIGKPTYGAGVGNYVDNDSSKIKYKLILNESTVLEVYGNILIQGLLGFSGQQGYQGHTSGNHSQIINNGTINLNNGAKLDLRGYIKGTGIVEARSGAIVYSPFVVRDFRGGSSSAGTYYSGVSPFNVYEMPNIQCLYGVNYGATHIAYMDLFGGGKHNNVTNNAIASNSAVIILKEGSRLIKTYDRDSEKSTLTIYGNVELGDLSMEVSGATIKMSDVRFPIPWNYTINIGDGIVATSIAVKNDYKIMTGATVNVKKNATVNLTGTVVIYKEFTDQAHAGWVYPNKEPAKFCVEGEVSVNGKLVSKAGIAGEITGLNGGKIIIGKNVKLQLSSKEGHATSIFPTSFVTVATISATAELVNANGNKITATTNKTYNYNNGTWQ